MHFLLDNPASVRSHTDSSGPQEGIAGSTRRAPPGLCLCRSWSLVFQLGSAVSVRAAFLKSARLSTPWNLRVVLGSPLVQCQMMHLACNHVSCADSVLPRADEEAGIQAQQLAWEVRAASLSSVSWLPTPNTGGNPGVLLWVPFAGRALEGGPKTSRLSVSPPRMMMMRKCWGKNQTFLESTGVHLSGWG